MENDRKAIKTKVGSLCFWGDWFGRPYDNMHTLVSCEIQDDVMRLEFDCGEALYIYGCDEITTDKNRTTIKTASKILLVYTPYGNTSCGAVNIEYERKGDVIVKNNSTILANRENHPALFFG